jgi:tetratricopeptide (TPR) repeat protein
MHISSPYRQRGALLAEQGRPELAEREFRRALADDPHDPVTHALLALVLADQERDAEAMDEAREAIRLAPDLAMGHYALARAHLEGERPGDALAAAAEAVRLDPEHPRGYSVHAASSLGLRRWNDALAAADTGLALRPDHPTLLNLRAQALVGLGRRDEAGATLHGALARDPENAATHAGQGWTLLHAGDRDGALRHFRESLRLDPEGEWARAGLAEALKARNPLYALMLRYFLWSSRLSPRARWGVILGGYFGYRIVRETARGNPGLQPFLYPLMAAYVAFVLLSWTAPQLFNAVLLLSRDGRYVLSDEQRRSGLWMAAGVGAALAVAAVAAAVGGEWLWGMALLFAFLTLPLASVFRGPRGRPVRGMAWVAAGLYAAAAASMALELAGAGDAAGGLFAVAMLGVVVTSWVGAFRSR